MLTPLVHAWRAGDPGARCRAMRQALLDEAGTRGVARRGGGAPGHAPRAFTSSGRSSELMALDDALEALTPSPDARKVRIAKLHYFRRAHQCLDESCSG